MPLPPLPPPRKRQNSEVERRMRELQADLDRSIAAATALHETPPPTSHPMPHSSGSPRQPPSVPHVEPDPIDRLTDRIKKIGALVSAAGTVVLAAILLYHQARSAMLREAPPAVKPKDPVVILEVPQLNVPPATASAPATKAP